MYQTATTAGATAGAGLASTGFAVGYWILAAFALVAAGSALLRIIPRRQA